VPRKDKESSFFCVWLQENHEPPTHLSFCFCFWVFLVGLLNEFHYSNFKIKRILESPRRKWSNQCPLSSAQKKTHQNASEMSPCFLNPSPKIEDFLNFRYHWTVPEGTVDVKVTIVVIGDWCFVQPRIMKFFISVPDTMQRSGTIITAALGMRNMHLIF
jgi:hypothetical protein